VGLLKYFQPHEVRSLIAAIAETFANVELVFDVMPHLLVYLAQRRLYRRTAHYTVPPMYWGLNRDQLGTIRSWHPHITEIREIPFQGGRSLQYRYGLPLLRQVPWLGNNLFSLVHVCCRAVDR
jgi:O-methyltransferase involved in polyketide biosynthesis